MKDIAALKLNGNEFTTGKHVLNLYLVPPRERFRIESLFLGLDIDRYGFEKANLHANNYTGIVVLCQSIKKGRLSEILDC